MGTGSPESSLVPCCSNSPSSKPEWEATGVGSLPGTVPSMNAPDAYCCLPRSAWPCSPPTGISSSAAISCVWSLPHTIPCQTTAFTCVFRCFPCDPSCGSASWATPEFTQHSVAPMVKMTRSKTFQAYLPSCHRTYSCIHCRAHLANHDELISKVCAAPAPHRRSMWLP